MGQRLAVPEAAEYLGVNVAWIRRAVAERRIPYIKLGARVIFDTARLDAYLEANTVEPSAPALAVATKPARARRRKAG